MSGQGVALSTRSTKGGSRGMNASALANKRIVITRAPHQAARLSKLLCARKAIPVLFPCIDIAPPVHTVILDAALKAIVGFDWLILTSPNTVFMLAQRLNALGLHTDWSQVRVAAVGTITAKLATEMLGVRVDAVPEKQHGEALAQAIDVQPGMRVLLPQSALAPRTLAKALTQRGAQVEDFVAYRTIVGSRGEDVPRMLLQGAIHALTFTSPSTVCNYFSRVPDALAYRIPVFCIGPSTAEAAQAAAFEQVLMPKREFSIVGLLDVMETYFKSSYTNCV